MKYFSKHASTLNQDINLTTRLPPKSVLIYIYTLYIYFDLLKVVWKNKKTNDGNMVIYHGRK